MEEVPGAAGQDPGPVLVDLRGMNEDVASQQVPIGSDGSKTQPARPAQAHLRAPSGTRFHRTD